MAGEAALLQKILDELRRGGGAGDGSGPRPRARPGGAGAITDPEKYLEIEKDFVNTRKEKLEVDQQLAAMARRKAIQDVEDFETRTTGRDLTDAEVQAYEALLLILGQTEEEMKGLTKAQKELAEQQAKGTAQAKVVTSSLFSLSSGFGKLMQNIPSTKEEFKSFAKEMKENVFSMKGLFSAGLKIFDMFMQLALAADEATSKFRQNTGAGKEFANNISDVRNELQHAGVGFEESGKALESLYGGMSAFTRQSDVMQTKLQGTVAVYDQLGVSMDVTTGILDQAMLSLGYDAEGSMDLVKQLDDTAVSLGKNISDVFADFASASKKLSFYGTDMINVFRKLEMQSKDTGLSVDELLGLTAQFDTFEGAGKAVGKLNALLGGPYLNSIDMLNATEDERIELLKQSMDASGTVFSDLSKFEQMAFADALGTDVDTLRRSLGALTPEQEEQIKVQEAAAARAADAKSAMEELALALRSLMHENKALFKDILNGIRAFADWIKEGDNAKNVTDKLFFAMKAIAALKFAGIIFNIVRGLQAMGAVKGLKLLWAGLTWGIRGATTAMISFGMTPVGAILTVIGIALGLAILHWNNMKDAGMETGDMIVDLSKKLLWFTGPIGMLVSALWSIWDAFKEGGSVMDIFMNALIEIMNNMSFGIFGWVMDKVAPGQAGGTRGGGWSNIERTQASNKKIKDGIVSDGQIIEVADNDTMIAARPGGGIGSVLGKLFEPQKMMAQGLMKGAAAYTDLGQKGGGLLDKVFQKTSFLNPLRYMLGPILKQAITDPVVNALGGEQGGAPINVTVYIGQEEVEATVIRALDSPAGRKVIVPWAS